MMYATTQGKPFRRRRRYERQYRDRQASLAIETPRGPVVESLMERGFAVHSINPKQLDRFRDRLSPAGARDDRRDARVLATALRR